MLSAILAMLFVVAPAAFERKGRCVLASGPVCSRLPSAFATRAMIGVLLLGVCCVRGAAHADTPKPRASAHDGSRTNGQTTTKTRAKGQAKKRAKAQAKPKETAASRRAARLGLGTRPAAGQLLAGRAEAPWIRAAGPGDKLPGTLKLPVVKGWFVRGFGSGEGGYHQAMDIGGEVGWNVRAAAPGIVGYAGDEINGYGNLVILIHPGGWITTYAHNAKNLVSAGQRIDRGSVVAELGSTGRSKGPHVHFELLFRGENCDPGPLFRPGVSHRNRKAVAYPKEVWRVPGKRPRKIQCHPRKHHPDYGHQAEPDITEGETESAEPGLL